MLLLIDEQSQEPHYKLLWQTHAEFHSGGFGAPLPMFTEVATQTAYDPEMLQTYEWQMAISRGNIHRELRFGSTKLFPPTQARLSPSVRLLFGLGPIMPRTGVYGHLQHLLELGPAPRCNHSAQAQLSLGSCRQITAFPLIIFIGFSGKHLFSMH